MDEPIPDEMVERIREVLGEHFHNWVFAVEGIEGDFNVRWSTPIVGKALLETALESFNTDDSSWLDWGQEWEDEGEEWKEE